MRSESSRLSAACVVAVIAVGCGDVDGGLGPAQAGRPQASHVAAITGVTAAPTSVSQGGMLTVTWTAPAGAAGTTEYKVRFECTSSCSGAIGSEPQTTGTSVTVNVGVVSGTYRAWVRIHTGSHDWYSSNSFEVQAAPAANAAPVLGSIGPKEVDEGSTLAFTATATDDPAQTLTYSLSGAPAGASIGGSSGGFAWTPADNGVHTMLVRVTDSGSPALSAEEAVVVTVHNVAPSVELAGSGPVFSGVPFALSGSFTDPGVADGPWPYALSCDTQAGGQAAAPGGFAAQVVCYGTGARTARASVTDKDGASSSASASVQVQAQPARMQIHPRTVKMQDKSSSVVSLIVFGGAHLDVMTAGAVRLGGASPLRVASSDADGDGYPDLVLHYERAAVGFQAGSQTFVIQGVLANGTAFAGSDTVRVQ